MDEIIRIRVGVSDIRKSKTCPESYRRIKNLKLAALVVIGVTFATCGERIG